MIDAVSRPTRTRALVVGLAALLIATLHSGMHFGANVHTLTYVLMCVVTLSGGWGVYAYVFYPGEMMNQRGSLRHKEILRQIAAHG